MRAALVLPPGATSISQPYTSISYLAAAAKSAGHAVVQRDLGIELIHRTLAPERVRPGLEICGGSSAGIGRWELERPGASRMRRLLADRIEGLLKSRCPDLVTAVARARAILADPAVYYEASELHWAVRALYWTACVSLMEHYPWSWNTTGSDRFSLSAEPSLELLTAPRPEERIAHHAAPGTFLGDFYEETVLPGLLAVAPDYVGISLSFTEQLLPGLALAKAIKRRSPGTHVGFGGELVARFDNDDFPRRMLDTLLAVGDSVVVGEGETALVALLEQLDGRRDLRAVPNLITRDADGAIVGPQVRCGEDVNRWPVPDYAGLDLDLYLAPVKSLALSPSRGCYWKKCAFCAMSRSAGATYRERSVERFADDVAELVRVCGARHFMFMGDAITPPWLARASAALIARAPGIVWDTEVRFERAFTAGILRSMHQAGCRVLRFGFESGSQRVLDAMRKGTRLDVVERIIAACHDAGIRVGLQGFVGFPGETKREAEATFRFILSHRPQVSSATMTVFRLFQGSAVFADPETFGVVPLGRFVTGGFEYKVKRGMSHARANAVQQELIHRYTEEWIDLFNPLYNNACGSPPTLLYAARYGTAVFPRSRIYEQQARASWSRGPGVEDERV
jgi:anaerobic magnesium-protoporphyrin IX monomethyl ester cyclase